MYKAFFQLSESPFSLSPDPRFMYWGPDHEEALDHLVYGVEGRKGFILITGPIGTGKTTLTRALIAGLEGRAKVASIFNTFLNEVELLRVINLEYGLRAEGSSRQVLVGHLNRFLLAQLDREENVVLILDEAQNLSVPVLEQLRMLSNLETNRQKLIQIVLVGQPELMGTLNRPDLAQLDQRITVRYRLGPLTLEDTARYIHHRLAVAGESPSVWFDVKSVRLIHKFSHGIPRRINALCDRALLLAYARQDHTIRAAHVRQAQGELTGASGRNTFGWLKRLKRMAFSPSALVWTMGAGMLWKSILTGTFFQ